MAGFLLPGDAVPRDVKAGKKFSAGVHYNKPGEMIGGKESATGIATVTASSGYHKISVRGLLFTPTLVLAKNSVFSSNFTSMAHAMATIYATTDFLAGSYRNTYASIQTGSAYHNSVVSQGTGSNQFQIVADGFDMIVMYDSGLGDYSSGKNVPWIAIS